MGETGPGPGPAGLRGFAPALTTFVGRAEAVGKVCALLGKDRLVTVTGPGGVGKSRLVMEVARQEAGRFADGVHLVELAAVLDPALVPAAVVTALGAQQVPGVPVTGLLAGILERQQLLLVMDNCEHVLGAVAELLAGVLPVADDVRVLATSREPIGLGGEVRYRLGPLAVPGPDPAGEVDGFAAVALFADRAQRADPDFALDAATGPLVGRLVTRLDGMPLAIELAAARVETLGLPQLLDRLDDRLALLASTDRTAAARQRSLAATVDWSYQLLSEQDRAVFRRLAVFPGSFTLEAAGTVAGSNASPVVLRLVDCSLLTPPQQGPDGRARYLMLETLRAFGLERLAETEGERLGAEAGLARYELAVAEQAWAGMQTSDTENEAARWLDAEDANLHQALAWCLGHDPAAALRWPSLSRRGGCSGAVSPTDTPGCRPRPGTADRTIRPGVAGQVMLGEMAQDLREALDDNSAALSAAGLHGESPLHADALNGQAACLLNLRRSPKARSPPSRSRDARYLGYRAGEVLALVNLAEAAGFTGQVQEALEWQRQAGHIDLAEIPGRRMHERSETLVKALSDAGDVAGASGCARTAWRRARKRMISRVRSPDLAEAACLDLQTGQLAAAGQHLGQVIELALRTGYRLPLISCLDTCGYLCARRLPG